MATEIAAHQGSELAGEVSGLTGVKPDKGATVLETGGPNSIATSTGLLGDEWSLIIVGLAFGRNFTRYSEWLREIAMSTSVLTTRLNTLCEAGIFERSGGPGDAGRSEYFLTKRGRELWPILLAMWAWESRWGNGVRVNFSLVRHAACGNLVDPVLTCEACDLPVRRTDIDARFGPGGSWARSAPRTSTRRRPATSRARVSNFQTAGLLGDRTSAAIIGAASLGSTRFSEFERRTHSNPSLVAERLRTFCALGILDTAPSPDRADRVVYKLTDKGNAFYPVMALIIAWGERWFVSPEGPALNQTHLRCGAPFAPKLTCGWCNETLSGWSTTHERIPD